MVVFVVAMLKSNLERIPKQNMHVRIKENSIPPRRISPYARVYIKNFHLSFLGGIPAKSSEIPPRRAG